VFFCACKRNRALKGKDDEAGRAIHMGAREDARSLSDGAITMGPKSMRSRMSRCKSTLRYSLSSRPSAVAYTKHRYGDVENRSALRCYWLQLLLFDLGTKLAAPDPRAHRALRVPRPDSQSPRRSCRRRLPSALACVDAAAGTSRREQNR